MLLERGQHKSHSAALGAALAFQSRHDIILLRKTPADASPRERSLHGIHPGSMMMRMLSTITLLVLMPAALAAAERPDWAFPPAGVTGAPRQPDTGELKRVPGSTRTY